MTAQTMQIGSRPCRIYGEAHAEYLLLQMTGEHELQSMDNEVAAIAQSAHRFLFAAIPVESWNDALSPWKSPAVWGKQGFGGNAADTLRFLTEPFIPTLKQQFRLPEDIKIILGGYSLAGLFALWASTQTKLFYGVAAASPSVWFPDWMEFEQRHPMQVQHIYLSLGDKEEHTKYAVMAVVGDNIRVLHSRLIERGADCTLEWNSGGHFKNADLRTAKAFDRCRRLPGGGPDVADCKAIWRSGHHPMRHRSPNRAGRCTDAGVRQRSGQRGFCSRQPGKTEGCGRNTGLRPCEYVPCQARPGAESERFGIHRRQHRRSHAAAL